MEAAQTILLVVQVFVALTLIGFILIQHGKGADAGAAFGSGASGTVFGSRGSSNFLTKTTTVLAAAFLINSLTLAYLATQREAPTSLMENAEMVEQSSEENMLDEIESMMKKSEEMDAEKVVEGTDMDVVTDMPEPLTEPATDLPALPE